MRSVQVINFSIIVVVVVYEDKIPDKALNVVDSARRAATYTAIIIALSLICAIFFMLHLGHCSCSH